MKLTIFLALLFVSACLALPTNTERKGFLDNFTPEQKACLVKAFKEDATVRAQVRQCHVSGGGIDCLKKIPALAKCFN